MSDLLAPPVASDAARGHLPGEHPGRSRYVPVSAAVVAVAAAGLAFGRVFTLSHVVGPVVVATVIGAGAGVVGRLAVTPPKPATAPTEAAAAWLVNPEPAATVTDSSSVLVASSALVAAVLVAAVVTAGVFASPHPGVGGAFDRGLGSLAGAWSRILTTTVPVPPSPDRLPLVGGIVAAASAGAVLLAGRPRPGLTALVPGMVVLLMALVLGVGGPGSLAGVVGPFVVVATVYLLLTSRPSDRGATWVPPVRALAAAFTGLVVLVVALLVGTRFPLATTRPPANLRNSLSPPVALGTTANPLDQLPARQADGGATLFTAHVDQAWLAGPVHWRLASLDVYTGAGWTTDAQARRAGNVLPAPPGVDPAALGPSTDATLDRSGLAGPWVPTVGIPTGVDPADLEFDSTSSTLLTLPAASATRAQRYHLSGRLPQPTRAQLDQAGLAAGSAGQLTAVPACVPAALRRLAVSATAGLARPDQLAVALEQALAAKSGYTAAPDATSGSSCGRLRSFVAAKEGTAEQFATAYVLMARAVGLPARVAVGFQPGEIDRAAGTTTVHGADATVWPEVNFAALGWVAFDPVPSTSGSAKGANGSGSTPTTAPKGDQGLNQVRQTVDQHAGQTTPHGHHANGSAPVPAGRGSLGLLWWLVPIAVVLAAAAVAGARLLRRARRRQRRRTQPDPAERIRGAWAEILDGLAPHGVRTSSLTPREVHVATTLACEDAAGPVAMVAEAVDQAVYAGVADDTVAGAAWTASDDAVGRLRQAIPLGLRLRYLITGGPRGYGAVGAVGAPTVVGDPLLEAPDAGVAVPPRMHTELPAARDPTP